MKLHEYQAKQLFASCGIPIQRGAVAKTAEEARAVFQKIAGGASGGSPVRLNVKAQIHAGGRGKVGGVRAVGSAEVEIK